MTDETMVDDIGADIRAAMQAEQPPVPLDTEILPPDTQEEQPDLETAGEKADRTRDEHGRFAKAEETAQSEVAQVLEPAKPAIQPPVTFTPQEKAEFLSSTPAMQQAILRREKEIEAGFNQQQGKVEQLNKLDAAIAPVRDRIALSGLTPDTYVRALVQADEMLRGPQKVQALQLLAQQYGIDLGQMRGPPQGQPQDPQTLALQQYLAPLHQTIQQLQTRLDQGEQQRNAQANAAVESQVQAFAADPKNLYFSNVEDDMAKLIKAGMATTLEDAYDKACYARPDIRALMLATAAPKAQPAQTKPGGPQVIGAQKGAQKPNGHDPNSSIEDDIRAAFMEVQGRV